MKKFSKNLLYVLIGFCALWAVVLSLGAFGVIKTNIFAGEQFNYVVALILDAVCLALFVALVFVEKIKGLSIPNWFKCIFYVSFFVLTNIYFYFSLYSTVAGLIACAIILAVIFNIMSVSLFYNTQKDDQNNVKVSNKFLVFSCFSYSILFAFIYQLVVCVIRIVSKTTISNVLAISAIEMSVCLLISFVFALVFALSLARTKRVINACLIKMNASSDYKTKK